MSTPIRATLYVQPMTGTVHRDPQCSTGTARYGTAPSTVPTAELEALVTSGRVKGCGTCYAPVNRSTERRAPMDIRIRRARADRDASNWNFEDAPDPYAPPRRCWCGRKVSTLPGGNGSECAEHD